MVVASLLPIIVILFFAIKYSSDSVYTLQEQAIKDDLAVLTEAMLHEKLVPKTQDIKQAMIDNIQIMKLWEILNSEYKVFDKSKVSLAADAKIDSAIGKEKFVDFKTVAAELDNLLNALKPV